MPDAAHMHAIEAALLQHKLVKGRNAILRPLTTAKSELRVSATSAAAPSAHFDRKANVALVLRTNPAHSDVCGPNL